jgi:hypothetical protein
MDTMGLDCNMHGEIRNEYRILVRIVERDHSEELGTDRV